jgi:hypothetical protein
MLEKYVLAYFSVFSQHISELTEESNENPHLGIFGYHNRPEYLDLV